MIGLDTRQLASEEASSAARAINASAASPAGLLAGGGGAAVRPSMYDIITPKDAAVVCLGVHQLYVLHALYFNAQPFHAVGHALRRSLWVGQLWLWLHLPLAICLIAFGVSIKALLFIPQNSYAMSSHYAAMMCVPLGSALILIETLKALHTGFFNFRGCPLRSDVIESTGSALRHQSARRAKLFAFRCVMGVCIMLFSLAYEHVAEPVVFCAVVDFAFLYLAYVSEFVMSYLEEVKNKIETPSSDEVAGGGALGEDHRPDLSKAPAAMSV